MRESEWPADGSPPHCPDRYPGRSGSSNVREMTTDPALDILCSHGTRLPRHLASSAKNHQSRNAGNPELCRQRLLLLRVHLGQANVRLQPHRSLLVGRGHHHAGSAPGRPEIHHERDPGLRNVPIEVRLCQRDGTSRKQGCMALAALGTIGQTSVRNAIGTPAMGTDNLDCFTHACTGTDLQPLWKRPSQLAPRCGLRIRSIAHPHAAAILSRGPTYDRRRSAPL